MSENHIPKKDKSAIACCGCCVIGLLTVVLFFFGYSIWFIRVAESTIFLNTDNMTLRETHLFSVWEFDPSLLADPRAACYLEPVNKTAFCFGYSSGEIVLKETDDFLVFGGYDRGMQGIGFNPRHKFSENNRLEFYRVRKTTTTPNGTTEVKTDFLGSLETNLYKLIGPHFRISVSPDGKYAFVNGYAVKSRSSGKYQGREVMLIWEFGENATEKDLLDYSGKKIPIIVKTEEELEKELDEQYLKEARDNPHKNRPELPGDFIATPLDKTSVKLTWSRSRWADGYRVYQLSERATHWPLLATLEISPREYVVTGLSPNKTYSFKVEAFNSVTKAVSKHERTTRVTLPP